MVQFDRYYNKSKLEATDSYLSRSEGCWSLNYPTFFTSQHEAQQNSIFNIFNKMLNVAFPPYFLRI